MIRRPTLLGQTDAEGHAALTGEFERIGEQVLENLEQSLRVP